MNRGVLSFCDFVYHDPCSRFCYVKYIWNLLCLQYGYAYRDFFTKITCCARTLIDFVYNTLLHISITYFLLLLLQRPLELGADLVMHSCSKYLGGHADIISGVLATSQDNLFRELKTIQRYRGATPSAFDCYLLQRSLQTLEVSQ